MVAHACSSTFKATDRKMSPIKSSSKNFNLKKYENIGAFGRVVCTASLCKIDHDNGCTEKR
jgi:hypothetical protein